MDWHGGHQPHRRLLLQRHGSASRPSLPGTDKQILVQVNFTRIKKVNHNTAPKAPTGGRADIWDPEAFDAFWALYPKKKDKVKAIREWNKLKADRKLMKRMSAALKTQIASEEWQRDNGRAIPYPCRWLSHRRWEDQIEAAAAVRTREEALPEWI